MNGKSGVVICFLLLPFAACVAAAQSCPRVAPRADNAADAAYAKGNYNRAEDLYGEEFAKHPLDAQLSASLVQTWLHEGEIKQAAARAAKSIADNPNSAVAVTAQAEVKLYQGQPWLALATLDVAAKLDPCYARTHFVRSRVFRIDSRYASERAEIQAAYDIDPTEPDIHHAWFDTIQVVQDIESTRQSLATGKELDAETQKKVKQYIEDATQQLSENNQTCKVVPALTQDTTFPLTAAYHELERESNVKRDLSAIRPEAEERVARNTSRQLIGYTIPIELPHSKASMFVDTATSGLIITRALADANGFTAGVGAPPGTVHVDSLTIGSLEFKDCTVGVSETPLPDKLQGYIGTDIFGAWLVTLDLQNQAAAKLALSQLPSRPGLLPGDRPGTDVADPVPAALESFSPFYQRRHYILIPVDLNSRARRLFVLDSGLRGSTMTSEVAHSVSSTRVNFTNSIPTPSGATLEVYRDAFDFQFASLTLSHQSHIYAFDTVAVERASGIQVAGMLGFDILQSMKMQIDYRDGLIKFESVKFNPAGPKSGDDRVLTADASSASTGSSGATGPESNYDSRLDTVTAKRNRKPVEISLANLKAKPAADVLRDLTGVQLTERMTTAQLEHWNAAMPSDASRQTLTALADASAFLNLPAEQLPKTPPMDEAAQQQLLAQMNDYVDKTMAKFPNLFANQRVTTFEAIDGLHNGAGVAVNQPMHYMGRMDARVRYHSGGEVVETAKGEVKEQDQVGYKLLFVGEFGPVLNTVLSDAQQGKLLWSHWEPGATSPVAVFRYSVARKKSHCTIKVVMPGNKFPSHAQPGYHGEIAIDPANGQILRLTLISDLTQDDPMAEANLMVEYGPVEIGGQTYICPIRSVTVETVKEEGFNKAMSVVTTGSIDRGPSHDTNLTYAARGDTPSETLLNDVVFDHYQILRSEARVITGDEKAEPNH